MSEKCTACNGIGRRPNYNYHGERIMGAHDCEFCQGTGKIRRSILGCIELKCPKMGSCTEIICGELYEWARLHARARNAHSSNDILLPYIERVRKEIEEARADNGEE